MTQETMSSAQLPINSTSSALTAEVPIDSIQTARTPVRTSASASLVKTPRRRFRWAIYARKSTEKGLDSPFNSIDSQNYYCEKYIQEHEPEDEEWYVAGMYSDGGCSGYNTDRSDFQRLLADVKSGLFDGVAVYKSDRFARNLLDALQTIRVFRDHNVDFVSVTQKFDTTTPHGRFSMNIMFSFDECYRDTSREYTISKIAASKAKGMHMGGTPLFGYDVVDKKLVINESRAETVRFIFNEFIRTKSAKRLAEVLREKEIKTKDGSRYFTTHTLRFMLENVTYIGKVKHNDKIYDGQHQAIISDELWQAVRNIMTVRAKARSGITKRKVPAVLCGLLKCGGCDCSMSPAYTRKSNGKIYRYYVPQARFKSKCVSCPIGQVSAPEIESAVFSQIHQMFQAPEVLVQTWKKVTEITPNISEEQVREALGQIDATWPKLYPAEQERIMKLMLEKVVVEENAIELKIKDDGLIALMANSAPLQQKAQEQNALAS